MEKSQNEPLKPALKFIEGPRRRKSAYFYVDAETLVLIGLRSPDVVRAYRLVTPEVKRICICLTSMTTDCVETANLLKEWLETDWSRAKIYLICAYEMRSALKKLLKMNHNQKCDLISYHSGFSMGAAQRFDWQTCEIGEVEQPRTGRFMRAIIPVAGSGDDCFGLCLKVGKENAMYVGQASDLNSFLTRSSDADCDVLYCEVSARKNCGNYLRWSQCKSTLVDLLEQGRTKQIVLIDVDDKDFYGENLEDKVREIDGICIA